jgi:hypothetical protein
MHEINHYSLQGSGLYLAFEGASDINYDPTSDGGWGINY